MSENDATQDGPQAKQRKLRSPVYNHFTWSDREQQFLCNYCGHGYNKSKDGSTGPMVKHLQSRHKDKWGGTGQLPCHQIISLDVEHDVSDKTEREIDVKPYTEEGLRKHLLKFILLSDQPFTLVDELPFKELLTYVRADVTLPRADNLRREISKLYTENRLRLKSALLSSGSKLSFCVDGWTSKDQLSFQGVMVQWINKDWQLCCKVLDFTVLEGSPTGKNLAQSFAKVIEDYGVSNKVLGITTNNAANMNTFFTEYSTLSQGFRVPFDASNQRVRCLAHIINLACKDAIKAAFLPDILALETSFNSIEESEDSDASEDEGESVCQFQKNAWIGKLRKGIRKIRASPQRWENFKSLCALFKLENRQLILDVNTRWNSTLDMMLRAVEYRKPMECTLRSDEKLLPLVLNDKEWKMCQLLIDLLQPFQLVTLYDSGRYPTVSHCAAIYQKLFNHLEQHVDMSVDGFAREKMNVADDWLSRAAKAAWNKLKKYYPTSDGLVYVIGTILDPRCKLDWFTKAGWPEHWIEDCKAMITKCWNDNYKPKSNNLEENPPSNSATALTRNEELFHSIFNDHSDTASTEEADELESYLATRAVPSKKVKHGALGWWKINEEEYPHLAKMAKDFLAVSGSGVPVERMFSTGMHLLTPTRMNSDSQTIRECLILKNWLKSEQEVLEDAARAVAGKILEE